MSQNGQISSISLIPTHKKPPGDLIEPGAGSRREAVKYRCNKCRKSQKEKRIIPPPSVPASAP